MNRLIIWRTAFQSILKNKRRSMLTMLGIVIGISSVITIVAIGNGYKANLTNTISGKQEAANVKKITVTAYNMSDSFSHKNNISESDLASIRSVNGVEKADLDEMRKAGSSEGKGSNAQLTLQSKGKNLDVYYELANETHRNLVAGRQLGAQDNASLEKTVLLDKVVAEELYGDSESALNKVFPFKGQLFTVVGVSNNTTRKIGSGNYDSLVFFPKETYTHYFGDLKKEDVVTVTVTPDYNTDEVLAQVLATLNEQGTLKNIGTYEIYDTKDQADEVGQTLNQLTLFISAVAGISLVIAGVGVMNMMYISVSERIKEIGIRRALGATAGDIKSQFLSEGLALTLIGGLTGYLFGMGFAFLASIFLSFSVRPDITTILIAISISMFIGIVFSYFPAAAASKKELIDIMK